jgi:hypothetical protein
LPPGELASSFHPRGVVIADDLLYVSNVTNLPPPDGSGLGGQIQVYNAQTASFVRIFVDSGNCNSCDLNRPEGLVFGPDGNLYVTSFQANPNDTDKILIFAGPAYANSGAFIGQIVLDQRGDFRAYAQALLFGPGGLFVPITTPTGAYSGQVRIYDPAKANKPTNPSLTPYKIFAPSPSQNSPLGSSWYLTFGKTDPATLEYPTSP